MVQRVRQDEPLYSCAIAIDSITGNQDEEILTFGVSADDAKNKAAQLLAEQYGCNESQIPPLLQQAKIEPLAHWCSPNNRQE